MCIIRLNPLNWNYIKAINLKMRTNLHGLPGVVDSLVQLSECEDFT